MAVASAVLMGMMAGVQAGAPTTDGRFYGGGDNLRYPSTPYAVSENGSKMYVTLVNNVLYVALVVDRSFNDNVFDVSATDYMGTAGWTSGGNLTATRRIDSEYAEFNLIVGSGANEQTFNWKQGYAGQSDQGQGGSGTQYNRSNQTWISDHTINGGDGPSPPPGIVSASSFAWNMNNYAARLAAGTNTWTMPGSNNDSRTWKSPWKGANGVDENTGTVIDADEGYPATGQITWSPTYEWEWSMIYEWSVDMSQFGTSPVFVVAGSSHHSPSKIGPEDDEFPDVEDPPPLMDFGDLPDIYPTLLADDGARHIIDTSPGSALLGENLDSETDGQPHPYALGDDLNGVDDEDGVVLLTPMIPGQNAVFEVTIGGVGYLSAFIDFNGDEELQEVELVAATGPAAVDLGTLGDTYFSEVGVYQLTVEVPSDAEGLMPTRWRITNNENEGGNSVDGEALSGEVEDHIFLASVGTFVWEDLNGNGIFDDGEPLVEGVEVILLDADFNEVASTFTDENGEYSFSDLEPGDYRVLFDPPEGYEFTLQNQGLDPTINSAPSQIDGMTSVFTLYPGENNIEQNAGIVETEAPPQDPICATSWVQWQDLHGVLGEDEPLDNPDGDVYSNLLEYAFCLDPESGYTPVPPFCSRQADDGSIEVFMNRPTGLIDVTYTLYVTAVLDSPFDQWTEVTTAMIEPEVTPDGNREQVVWANVDDLAGYENGGFAVIKVDLDDGTTTATDFTVVCGWRKSELDSVCQTFSVPYTRHTFFSGTIASVAGNVINLEGSTNGLDFSEVLDSDGLYYIEVLSGDNEGHRFDVEAGGEETLTVVLAADLYSLEPHSTKESLGSSFEGDLIALRRHHTLGSLLAVEDFDSGESIAEADCVMCWNGTSYNTYWLADTSEGPQWVSADDPTLESANDTVIAPGTGMFIYRKTSSHTLVTTGSVRENDFVQPLRGGKTLLGAMYPVDQSANGATVPSRAMNLTQGFSGGGNAATSSIFQLWRADADPAAIGLSTYWHLDVGSSNWWVSSSSLANQNSEPLFLLDRAVLVTPEQDIPEYLIPAAWQRSAP